MISYREALDELGTLPWPEGVSYTVTPNMKYLKIYKATVISLNMIGLAAFEDCVNKAMIYLRAANPAIELRIV